MKGLNRHRHGYREEQCLCHEKLFRRPRSRTRVGKDFSLCAELSSLQLTHLEQVNQENKAKQSEHSSIFPHFSCQVFFPHAVKYSLKLLKYHSIHLRVEYPIQYPRRDES